MSRSYYAAPGSQIVVVETGRPSEPVQIGTGRTVGDARASLQETPINSSGGDPEGMALRWAYRQGWLDLHPDELTQLDVEEGEDDECDWGAWLSAPSSSSPALSAGAAALKSYRVSSKTGGVCLGTYFAASPSDALEALAREAGYRSHAYACEVTGEDGSDLLIEEVPEDEVTAFYTYAKGTSAFSGEWKCSRREAVKAAVEALGAEHVEGETWRYHADETDSDWLVEEDDLVDLGGGLLAGHTQESLYSHWCAEHEGKEIEEESGEEASAEDSWAYEAGYQDGLAWDLSLFGSADEITDRGWDESLINAMSRPALYAHWGLPEDTEWGGEAFRAACADYCRGCRDGALEPQECRTGAAIGSAQE